MMVKALKSISFAVLVCGVLSFACFAQEAPAGEQDPPSRAARLSYFNGSVSMEPAGIDDWSPVEVNRPFTTGDYLYTDQKAVAELQLDSAVFRMGQVTSFGFLNLNDQVAQLKLTEGDLYFRVHDLAPSQVYEIDTPNAAISLLREGVYRIHVDPDANTTFVSVREGQAEVTGGGEAFTLDAQQSANLSGTGQLAYDIEQAPPPDTLDNWCMQRDQAEMQANATRYVPPSMIGYSDLNQSGTWTEAPDYGPVWYPTSAPADWAPYHMGHWVWIDPWGWTWVDSQPWAFAPSHYGRWVYWHDRWGWAPGPVAVVYQRPVRPIWAPALVAWFGGAHWGVSVSFGGGPSLGWVPLGYGEIYTPAYHVGPTYFRNVNVYNTRVVNTVNITNVYNTVYVQKNVYQQTFVNTRVRNAVVAMPASAMASGRSVQQIGRPIPMGDVARIHEAHMVAPAVVPTRNGVAPLMGRPAPRPNQTVAARAVVARVAQPAAIVPFAQRQTFIQQHAGEPVNYAAMHQQFQSQARSVAVTRVEQQPRPIQVHTGERVGNIPAPHNAGEQQAHTNTPPPAVQAREVPRRAMFKRAKVFKRGKRPIAVPHGMPPNQTANRGYTQPRRAEYVTEPRQQEYQRGISKRHSQSTREPGFHPAAAYESGSCATT